MVLTVAKGIRPEVVDQIGVRRLDSAVDHRHDDALRILIDQGSGASPRRLGADPLERPLPRIERIVDHRRVHLCTVEHAVLLGSDGHANADRVLADRLDILTLTEQTQLGVQRLDRIDMVKFDIGVP